MDSEKARLTYSDSRGLAEKIRILLCLAEIPVSTFMSVEMIRLLKITPLCIYSWNILSFKRPPTHREKYLLNISLLVYLSMYVSINVCI